MDLHHGQWRQFYSFTEEPQLMVDDIAPTFCCEKHPDFPFIHQEMFSMKTAHGRYTLDGHLYKEFVDGQVTAKKLTDEEMPAAYRKFGLAYCSFRSGDSSYLQAKMQSVLMMLCVLFFPMTG